MNIEPIARIHTDFPTKFGVPRQSGLASGLVSTIKFEPPYRNPDCLRGIADFSHLWLIWEFDKVAGAGWSPTVLPPKLGGKTRVGVFATRSPFRPNHMGLSVVRLASVDWTAKGGPVLYVTGADMVDGTPIFDIKPYLPYTDAHPDATGGFTQSYTGYHLEVIFPPDLLEQVPPDLRPALTGVLAQDPRPSYQDDPERVYGMAFGGLEVKFKVCKKTLAVVSVEKISL